MRFNEFDLRLEQQAPGGDLTLAERVGLDERRVALTGDLAAAVARNGEYWYLGGPLGHPSTPAGTTEIRLVNRSGATRFGVVGDGVWLAVLDRTPANDDVTVVFSDGAEILDQFSVHLPEMVQKGDDDEFYYAPWEDAKDDSR